VMWLFKKQGLILWALVLATLLILSFWVPPLQSPDEHDHIKRAYLLAQGQVVLTRPSEASSGGMVDKGLLAYLNANPPFETQKKQSVMDSRTIQWTHTKSYAPAPGTGYYFPAIYLPQAFALKLGNMLNWSVHNTYQMARVVSIMVSVFFLWMAFRNATFNVAVWGIVVMPMSLFQLSSASIDGLSVALTLYAVSIFIKIVTAKKYLNKDVLMLTLIIAVVASSRVHMLTLFLLPLYILFKDFSVSRAWVICSAILLVVGWTLFAMIHTVDLRVTKDLNTVETLWFYINQPELLWQILYQTLTNSGQLKFYLISFLGVLGWLDVVLSKGQYISLVFGLLLLCLLSIVRTNERVFLPVKLCLLTTGFGAILLILLALLLTWTPIGATSIEGIQGRYFILPALLLAAAVSLEQKQTVATLDRLSMTALSVFFAWSYWITFSAVVARYHVV